MTTEQKEGNAIIAKWDGRPFIEFHGMICECEEDGSPWDNDPIEWLDYHQNWQLLMSVVEKIMEIDITPAPNYEGYRMEIVPRGYVRITGSRMPTIFTNVSIEGSLIAAVYKAVVVFINYHNSPPNKA